MSDVIDRAEELERLEIENLLRALACGPSRPIEMPTIHFTQIAEADGSWPLAREWNFYRREVGRLIAEGHEGEWVLIEGEAIIGFWETREDMDDFLSHNGRKEAVLIRQISTYEPVFRIGYNHLRWPD